MNGNIDLGQLQATMQAIEIACTSIQVNVNPSAAEATILSLCQSPRPYQACQFIIENSTFANARFQAATAIRDAAIREWSFLSPDGKKSLISFCLSYVMKHASSPEGYVLSKISSVAAQLMKRGWLEFTAAEREGFFSEIKLAIVGKHGVDVQFTGLNFLESLVSEFSPSTSTALGLPREFHEQCRKSWEHDYLKIFYCWALKAAQSVTTEITNSDAAVSEARVCATALGFMLQILNWDFSNSGRVVKNNIDVFSFVAKEDSNSAYTLVQPGLSWRDVLITSGHIEWLLGLYGMLREKFSYKGYWMDCPLAVSARKLIVQLCSLTGTIFPSDAGVSQGKHLLQLISGIVQWVHPPDAIAKAIECGRSESELLDGCRGLLSIAAVTNPVTFDDLLKHIRPFGTLSLLSALMCEVIKDLMTKDLEEEPWSWVARDILLDTWTLLTDTNSYGVKSVLPLEGINAAAKLFALIVESELQAASASEEKEEYFQASVAAMDERLVSYALIARAAIEVTIPFLTGLFSERFARLHQGSGIIDPTTTMEELYSLLLITGHVLADDGEGETPLIPMVIETRFPEYVETDKHPVVLLSWSIIKFSEQSLDPNMRAAFFSPRLMEAIIWFLARWSSTYLMTVENMQSYRNSIDEATLLQIQHSRKALLSFSADYTQGNNLLNIIVRISLTTLISYVGEKDLQALTCNQLLGGVVRRKNICTHLVTMDSWRELAHCFTSDRELFSLNASHQMNGNIDLGQLQATMQAIEIACTSIQVNVNPSAAEATILSLCQSPRPYQACQFIIENSTFANARFQAATAIRDAAIREWSFLSPDGKKSLISFCLSYVMKHASSPEGYVLSKISSVAAQLMKRGWLEFTAAEREGFFSEIKLAIVGKHGVDVQFTGLNFLESLVSEFSPSTSTALGLPREFHEQCRKSLEHDYLKIFYCWALKAAQSVTTEITNSDAAVSEARVCATALGFMLQILNWDFSNSGRVVKNNIDVFSFVAKEDSNSAYTLVQPGLSWRDVLITSGHIEWLLGLYGMLREKFSYKGYWMDCPLAVSARKLIVQLCSLTGTIFPSDAGVSQGKHLLQLISGIVQWVHPPDAIAKAIECGRSESELLDGCRGLLSIAAVTNPVTFDDLLKHIRPFGTLSLLSALMCEVIKDLMTKDLEEEPWSWVARDILLDTWTLLTDTNSYGVKSVLPLEGINAAAKLFALIVESELQAASASEEKEEYFQASVAAMDERLVSYALIARAAIEVTIPFLTGLFSERFARLHQGSGIIDPTTTMEELYSLLLITGHVLADDGEGETPLIPMVIETRFPEYVETDKHPVVLLSWSIIKFSEQSLDPNMRAAFFSPRLMEAIIWFLARWSSTYLMTVENMQSYRNSIDEATLLQIQHSRKALLSFSADYTQGNNLLNIIVRISLTTLISYVGEKDLQALTCNQLLGGVVRRKNICTHLVTMDSWRELAHCFTSDRELFSLNASHQRSLAQTLVLSASSIKSSEEANQYIRDLTTHMTAYLNDISGKKDINTISQQPDVILVVTCLLERLRGASSASEPRTQKAIYEMGFSVMQSILKFLEIYKDERSFWKQSLCPQVESAVVYLLLKAVVDWVDGQIIYLEPHETALVVDFCMHLLQLYSSHNIGKISLSVSSSLLTEANDDKYRDLRALLQLLQKLCTKDMVDVSSAASVDQQTSISQVIYVGAHIVSPLITIEMLKYPKLCDDYFALLSHMLEVYPEMIPKLNHEAFSHISRTLDFGLHHQDEEIVGMCLRSLRAVALYHYNERGGGKDGLGPHATSYKDASGNLQDGILSKFLRSLLQLILFEDYSTDLVGAAADALFPLILCDHGLYQRLGNELVERQPNSVFKTRMASALHSLTTSDDLSPSADRSNMRKFRKNLNRFLVDVRGFLRII